MSHNDKQFATVFVAVLGALAVLAIILFFIAGYLTKEVSSYKEEEIILGNIEPVGKVNIDDGSAPQAPAAAAAPVASAATELAPGEEVYQKSCMSCHATGAAGAPKLGDADAWAPRIAKGMDTVMSNVTNGLNAMPPKGLCMTCSEDELKDAVDFMISRSQPAAAAEEPSAVAEAPAAAAPVATAAAESASGEQIYQRNCMACHTTGAAGAPKIGDAAAWASRLAQGMETVMANVKNGKNAMPPKGLCMTCTDDELKAVVDYILAQSQ